MAGGVATLEEITKIAEIGCDVQLGMALYTGALPLGEAVAAPLARDVDGVWPTVVRDESGEPLGLVWSTRETLARAVTERRGIYWSRSRAATWIKGETSGSTQELLRVELDCDRDAILATVRQAGDGFCHAGPRTCWGERFVRDDQGGITFMGNSRYGWYSPGNTNLLSFKYDQMIW